MILGEAQRALAISRALEEKGFLVDGDSSADGARRHCAAARDFVGRARGSPGRRADRRHCHEHSRHEKPDPAQVFSLDRRAVAQAFDRASASYDAAAACRNASATS